MVIALDSVGTKAKSPDAAKIGQRNVFIKFTFYNAHLIRGAVLHVVVVIALGMSPVFVGFSHTLPDGLLLLFARWHNLGAGSLEGTTLRPSTRRRGNQHPAPTMNEIIKFAREMKFASSKERAWRSCGCRDLSQ
jgi:hypothetical protein